MTAWLQRELHLAAPERNALMFPGRFSLKGTVFGFFSLLFFFTVRTAFKGYSLPTCCMSKLAHNVLDIKKSSFYTGAVLFVLFCFSFCRRALIVSLSVCV